MSIVSGRLVTLALGAAFLASLAACGGTAATNDQAQASQNALAGNGMAAMEQPSTPFSQSEMRMHEEMMAANGATTSDTWARKMIAHHRGAVEMSEILLAEDSNSRFADMARKTAQDQTAEIQQLERMLANGEAAAP